jgi:hypothetical protein
LSAFSSINDKINTLIKIDGFDIKSEESEFVKKEIETTGTEYSSKPSWSISSAKTFEREKRPRRRVVSEGKEPIKKEFLKKNLKKKD